MEKVYYFGSATKESDKRNDWLAKNRKLLETALFWEWNLSYEKYGYRNSYVQSVLEYSNKVRDSRRNSFKTRELKELISILEKAINASEQLKDVPENKLVDHIYDLTEKYIRIHEKEQGMRNLLRRTIWVFKDDEIKDVPQTKGYIGVTSREWFTYLSNNDRINEVNYWRKNTDHFNVLTIGEPFFFLVKNEKGVKGERTVLGKATFERFETLTVNEAWEKYGNANGDEDREHFVTRMNGMFGTDTYTGLIGCIILSDFQIFKNPVYLSNIGIEFKNSVVSGKSIDESEINLILEYGYAALGDTVKTLKQTETIGFTEDDEGFPEGKLKLKQHLVRERNPEVIKLAKKRFIQQYGKLYCEVCGFDFKEQYGEIGDGYIEGHHTKPVSELEEDELTKEEDIAIVCSNCHRMLHRKRPWLSIDQLKELLVKN